MLRTYGAVYRKGVLNWLGRAPNLSEGSHVLVVVEAQPSPEEYRITLRRVLDKAWGAWGIGKTPDEIDRELAEMREEWEQQRDEAPS